MAAALLQHSARMVMAELNTRVATTTEENLSVALRTFRHCMAGRLDLAMKSASCCTALAGLVAHGSAD
eukprot:12636195-Alexandrium_andersonii.AAC.1